MSLHPPKEASKINCKSRPDSLPSLISPMLDELKLSSLLSRGGYKEAKVMLNGI